MSDTAFVADLNYYIHSTLSVCLDIKKNTHIPYFADFYIQKLLTNIFSSIRKSKAQFAVLCRDSRSFRKQSSDTYKISRKYDDNMPEYFEMIGNASKKLEADLNIATISVDGLEADDLCRLVALDFAKNNVNVLLYSGDKDFMQLVTPEISYFYAKSKTIFCHDSNFYKFDTMSKVYSSVNVVYEAAIKIVFGDKSDEIESAIHVKSSKKIDTFLYEISNDFDDVLNLYQNLKHLAERLLPLTKYKNAELLEIALRKNADLVCLLDVTTPTILLESYTNLDFVNNLKNINKKFLNNEYVTNIFNRDSKN
jgi:DNA polymerase-1